MTRTLQTFRSARAGAVIALLVVGTLLAACSPAQSSAKSTPAPTASTLGKVTTIDQLVKAYVAAGGVCNWKQDDVVRGAVASGTCSKAATLSIYTSSADRDKVVSNMRTLPIESTLLVGENWIINAADAPGMKDKLGGEAITGMPESSGSFCGEFRAGEATYREFLSSTSSTLDVNTFKAKIQPYVATVKRLAPSEEAKDVADYTSPADQITAVLANGGGQLTLNTESYKLGALNLLTYCAGKA